MDGHFPTAANDLNSSYSMIWQPGAIESSGINSKRACTATRALADLFAVALARC